MVGAYLGSDYLYAFNAATGALLWKEILGKGVNPLAIANGVLYAGGNDDYFYALNAATGAVLWKYPTGAATRAAVANGVVYVVANRKYVYALSVTTGKILWLYNRFSDNNLVGPVVANGMVYFGSQDSNLYTFYLPGQ